MGSKCRATVGNGFEPASSELHDATRYIVNPPGPHQRPHTHSRDTSPFTEAQRTQLGPLDHRTIWTRLCGFMILINEISQKFPLISPAQAPHHRPHTQSQDTSPFTRAKQTQPSLLDHRTHTLYGKTLWLYGLN